MPSTHISRNCLIFQRFEWRNPLIVLSLMTSAPTPPSAKPFAFQMTSFLDLWLVNSEHLLHKSNSQQEHSIDFWWPLWTSPFSCHQANPQAPVLCSTWFNIVCETNVCGRLNILSWELSCCWNLAYGTGGFFFVGLHQYDTSDHYWCWSWTYHADRVAVMTWLISVI